MPELLPVFSYGSLRPGDYNHDRFPGGVKKVDRNFRTRGRLYHAFTRPGRVYPGARFDEVGTIVGDVLWYEQGSEALHSVVRMELGAGYSLVEIKVENDQGESLLALGFQYEMPHGSRIESGDWFSDDAYPSTDLSDFAEDEYGEDWQEDDWDEED